MTITIQPINANTDNWMDTWTKFNLVANAMSTSVLTVDSNTTNGHASVNGSIGANTLYVEVLSGGRLGNTQPFTVATFVTFSANTYFAGANNSLGNIANTHALGANSTHKTVMANNTTGRLRWANLNEEIQAIDGANSGIDSDLLDGQHGSYYTDIAARQGFTSANKAGDTFTGTVTVPLLVANTINANIITDNTISLGNTSIQSANTIVASNTAPVLLDTLTTGIAGKYVVTRDWNGQKSISESFVIAANTTSSNITEYGILNTGNTLIGTLSTNNAAGSTRLWITPEVGTTAGTPLNIRVHRLQL